MFLFFVAILACFHQLDCHYEAEVHRLNFFDTDLLRYAAEDKTGNVMVSPASVKSLLAMVLEGSGGATANEIRSALRLSPNKNDFREQLYHYLNALNVNSSGVLIHNANAVFISNKLNLRKEFEVMLRKVYYADIGKVDFTDPIPTSDFINKWVKNHTSGLIDNIVEPAFIKPSTDMMLTNALYFKSSWKYAFDPKWTKGGCFFVEGQCRKVAMMEQHEELNYAYIDNLRAHALELPYEVRFCLLAVVYVVSGRGLGRSLQDTSFVGKATDELSTAILQGYIDDDKNIAFSPLGYSAILAILAEGASGETRKQLVSALHLPEDQKLTRNTYHYILDRLRFRNEYKYNQPELKNYFYIYKNYTINEEYKKILEDFYLTDVKFVEKYATDHFSSMDDEDEKEALKDEKFEEPKESQEKLISYAIEDKPEKVDVSDVGYAAKNIKEQIALIKKQDIKDVKDGNEEETMVAVEARHHAQATAHVLSDKNDITSSLSVNSVGRKSSKSTNPLILIFNGMYFKGSWKKPFDSVESGLFYKSNTEKKQVPMMKTHGSFKTASLPDLDSYAILLPYDGGRYALMLLVPRARDGLVRLIADLPATSLPQIQESLQEEDLQVSLPSFLVETTTKPVSALAKFGVSSIFGHEAELAGVSEKEGLFVQELVQNVAVRVDNADSSASEILASNLYESEDLASLKNLPLNEEPRRFTVDHPFVFYILDCLDNVVVVSGKVIDPQAPDN